MAIATRSTTTSPVKKSTKDISTAEPKQQREPLKHFILPKDISSSARFVLLKHPQDSSIQRFLFCPEKGLFQFTKIHTPSSDPRSLLFAKPSADAETDTLATNDPKLISDGYISKSAELLVATHFDVAFLLIRLAISVKAAAGKMLFQPLDDLLEQHVEGDKHLRYILEKGRHILEEGMSRFCDTIDAGGEQMFRPSEDKMLAMVLEKVDNVLTNGMPSSMEDKFVTRALEAPVLSVKREESMISSKSESRQHDESESTPDNLDSQSTATSSAPSMVFSEVSTASSASSAISETIPTTLLDLQKRSTILDFILASYMSKPIASRLKARLSSDTSPINFAPLDEHLKSLTALKAEAIASRSMGDFSRKRGLDDDWAEEVRAEKKRKLEEEEKKKKSGESRGVRDLKKVNVTGMKKMSDFFAKKPAAKAKG